MQIEFGSMLVDDQDRALAFYTNVLGFQELSDIPMGEARWLTVTSPDGVERAEVVLEPMSFPPRASISVHCTRPGSPRPRSSRRMFRVNTRA